jgi:hypothetical protein
VTVPSAAVALTGIVVAMDLLQELAAHTTRDLAHVAGRCSGCESRRRAEQSCCCQSFEHHHRHLLSLLLWMMTGNAQGGSSVAEGLQIVDAR